MEAAHTLLFLKLPDNKLPICQPVDRSVVLPSTTFTFKYFNIPLHFSLNLCWKYHLRVLVGIFLVLVEALRRSQFSGVQEVISHTTCSLFTELRL